jgi:hypothetical protein
MLKGISNIIWRFCNFISPPAASHQKSLRVPNLLAGSRPIVSPGNTKATFPIWRMASPRAPLNDRVWPNLYWRFHQQGWLSRLKHENPGWKESPVRGCQKLCSREPFAAACYCHLRAPLGRKANEPSRLDLITARQPRCNSDLTQIIH